MIHFVLLISRQGKVRLTKWYSPYSAKEKSRAVREVSSVVLSRQQKQCNFLEYKDKKIIYKRCVLFKTIRPSEGDNVRTQGWHVGTSLPKTALCSQELPALCAPAYRYASLYFLACVDDDDNELIVLETIHHFVEVLDRYFGNVCELDLIFNFHKVSHLSPFGTTASFALIQIAPRPCLTLCLAAGLSHPRRALDHR